MKLTLAFWIVIALDVLALGLLLALAQKRMKRGAAARVLSLALGLLFIFGTAANCANGVHAPLLPSLIGLALSSAASCLAFEGAQEGPTHE